MNNTTFQDKSLQPATQMVELTELKPSLEQGGQVVGAAMELFQDIRINLSVFVGEAQITLGELTKLKESAVLELDRQVDCPVDVIFNGNVVARGQLAVVGDNFAVKITEVALTPSP